MTSDNEFVAFVNHAIQMALDLTHANCLLLDVDYSYTSCMSTLDDMMSIRP